MKKVFAILVSAALITGIYSFIPATKIAAPVTYTVTAGDSKIDWIGSKKAGYHPGYFPVKSGQVFIDNGKLTGGKFVIDIAGVKVTDGAGEKLEGHLKAPDFFDVAKFPEATFEITGVNYSGATAAEITGTLNLKGANVPVKFPAYIRNADEKGFFAEGFFSVDKNVLGLTYGKGMVSDDVQIAVHIFAKK